eukprot:178275-Prorocentrum_minimum.AAC.1
MSLQDVLTVLIGAYSLLGSPEGGQSPFGRGEESALRVSGASANTTNIYFILRVLLCQRDQQSH